MRLVFLVWKKERRSVGRNRDVGRRTLVEIEASDVGQNRDDGDDGSIELTKLDVNGGVILIK